MDGSSIEGARTQYQGKNIVEGYSIG